MLKVHMCGVVDRHFSEHSNYYIPYIYILNSFNSYNTGNSKFNFYTSELLQ